MARAQYHVGMDIGSSAVRAVAAEFNGGLLHVVGAGEASLDGMRKGAVVEADSVGRAIRRALFDVRKTSGMGVRSVTAGIGEPKLQSVISKGSVSISRADGVITKEDTARAMESAEAGLVRMNNRDIIHSFSLYYSIDRDSYIRDPVGLNGAKLDLDALFITGFLANINNFVKAIEHGGVVVDTVVASPYGTAYHALSRRQREVGSLVLDIGAHTSSLAVFEDGMLVSLEILPVGSGHISHDIALGFQIDLESAERVKRNLGIFLENGKKEIRLADFPKGFEETFSSRKLNDIVNARLGDIFELVQKHLKKIGRAELLPGGAVLVGGGARLFGIQAVARNELRLPVEIGSGTVGISGKKELVSGPEWTAALGLSRYSAENGKDSGSLGSILPQSVYKKLSRFFRSIVP